MELSKAQLLSTLLFCGHLTALGPEAAIGPAGLGALYCSLEWDPLSWFYMLQEKPRSYKEAQILQEC